MSTETITYTFYLRGKEPVTFPVEIDYGNDQPLYIREPSSTYPKWVGLEEHQCPHCPLNTKDTPYCPVAIAISGVLDFTRGLPAHQDVDIEVLENERTTKMQSTLQDALSSLLGLVIATSGCPYTEYFKPMARFHLPLATYEETVYRAASMYLMSQYYVMKKGERPDLELNGLKKIYNNLHIINQHMASRLKRGVSHRDTLDATFNAMVILDSYAATIQEIIDDSLTEFKDLFSHYLNNATCGT